MDKLRILFLGAGKRVSLLERFEDAAIRENVELEMWSMERDPRVPISIMAHIPNEAVSFHSTAFPTYLANFCFDNKIDIVIPCMDSATITLSAAKLGDTHAVVSDEKLCLFMEDKTWADDWFRYHEIPVPNNKKPPFIVKERKGYGAKGQFFVNSSQELVELDPKRYFYQEVVFGQEYTVDAYVFNNGKSLTFSRARLVVEAGEVMVSEAFRHEEILKLTDKILKIPGWYGPITLQFIETDEGPKIIEINPRFGGGVIHAIQCGLDMPRWIIREYLDRPITYPAKWGNGSRMVRYRSEVFV